MDSCETNSFCQQLPPETRNLLCANCVKVSYAAGTIERRPFQQAMLMLEGILMVESDERPSSILVSGDFNLTPKLGPKPSKSMPFNENELDTFYQGLRWHCIIETRIAFFPDNTVKAVLNDLEFCHALISNLEQVSAATSCYSQFLYHGTAKQAIVYALRLAKANGITGLTHAQIALLSGRNRVTVTKIMHEIAQSDPELIEDMA